MAVALGWRGRPPPLPLTSAPSPPTPQSTCAHLQTLLDASDPPPPRLGGPPPAGAALAAAAATLARRLAFTAAAPPGWAPGAPLGMHRPPAPQEWQLRASGLRAAAAAAARGAAAAAKAAAAGAAGEGPPPPQVNGGAAAPAGPQPPPPARRPPPPVAPLPGFDLVLNPDLEAAEEEWSSSEEESE